MKTNTEYPATHSMSTAWYIVDDDGNVGILDYNENGPVPNGVAESGLSELVWGLYDDEKKYKQIPIKLSIDQIRENLSKGHSQKDEVYWIDRIVKIKVDQTERFRQLCNNKAFNECICISEEEGYYIIDAMYCVDFDTNIVIEGSPLDTMLKEGIIEKVYNYFDFYNDDTFNQGTNRPIHSKQYDSSSFFIYHQPYWEDFLPEKMSSPTHPVKIAQFPDEVKEKFHHIPGNFYEIDTFQIAEFYPSKCWANSYVIIDGCKYILLPLPDGTEAYLLTEDAENQKKKYTIEEFETLCKLGRAKKQEKDK